MAKFLNKSKIFIIVVAIMLLAVGCNKAAPPQTQPVPQNENTQTQAPAPKEYSYNGLEGQDALSLLKLLYTVETKDFGPGLGEFVESINGVKPASDEFWAFYVNSKSSDVGASSYVTKNSDMIEWKLEKITY